MELTTSGKSFDYFTEYTQGNETLTFDDPYLRPPIRAALIATYLPIFIMGMMGNLLVIFVIARNRSMQTVTNFFLANLAVADLLVALCCVIPKLLWFILESWTLGSFVCRMHSTMISLTTNASIFILTVISAERFIAIVYPFETKQILTSRRLFVAVVAVWCLSAILSSPTAYFHEIVDYAGNHYCSPSTVGLKEVRTHTTTMFFLCFICPLIIMSILYLKISRRLWTRNRTGKLGMVSRNNYNYTRRASVDAVLEKADIGVFRDTDSPIKGRADKVSKARPCIIDEVTSFIPKTANETSNCVADAQVQSITTCTTNSNPENYCVKIGPFFLDEPEDNIEPDREDIEDPNHKWKLCKDPPMGLTKIDLKHVKFGFDNENVKRVRTFSQSEDCLDGLTTNPNGRTEHGDSDIITDCDKSSVPGRSVLQSPRIKLTMTQAQFSFDSPCRDRDSPVLSVSGNTPTASISSKIARRKKQKNAKAVMIARKKVIRLLIIMLVAFAVCMFPMQLILFWSHYGEFPQHTTAGALLIPFAYAAYFFNSALNPFLYAFLSDNFRTKMKETLCIPSKTGRDIRQRHKKVRHVPSEALESDWTHSLHLTTDASLHH